MAASSPNGWHTALVTAATAAILGREDRPWFNPAAPLVVVSKDVHQTLLGDLFQACAEVVPDAVMRCDGAALGAEFAACGDVERMARVRERLLSHRLVVVDRIDQLGSGRRQLAAARFLDAAAASGTFVCVSLAERPDRAALAEPLASRLAAGLVIMSASSVAGPAAGERPWSMATIIRGTARHQGVSPAILTGHGRQRSVVAARCLAMYLARRLTGRSLEAIGAAFGGREHTTVLRGIRGVSARIATDVSFAGDVERLVSTMRASGAGGPSRFTRRRA
jgi:chromosomal replication initiation ATPase DnaA